MLSGQVSSFAGTGSPQKFSLKNNVFVTRHPVQIHLVLRHTHGRVGTCFVDDFHLARAIPTFYFVPGNGHDSISCESLRIADNSREETDGGQPRHMTTKPLQRSIDELVLDFNQEKIVILEQRPKFPRIFFLLLPLNPTIAKRRRNATAFLPVRDFFSFERMLQKFGSDSGSLSMARLNKSWSIRSQRVARNDLVRQSLQSSWKR